MAACKGCAVHPIHEQKTSRSKLKHEMTTLHIRSRPLLLESGGLGRGSGRRERRLLFLIVRPAGEMMPGPRSSASDSS